MIAITTRPSGLFDFSGNEIRYNVSVVAGTAFVDVSVSFDGIVFYTERMVPVGNQASFDLHNPIDIFLRDTREVPTFQSIVVAVLGTTANEFNIHFEEVNSIGKVTSERSESRLVLMGKTDVDTAYFKAFVENGSILSYAPQPMPFTPAGVVRFSYLNLERRALKVLVQFELVTGVPYTVVLHTEADCAVGTWHFALPYALLRTAATTDFYSAKIWLRNAANANISSFTSIEMRPATDRDRWLVFENSVGGWDSWRAIGRTKESVGYERTEASNDLYTRALRTAKQQVFSVDLGIAGAQYNEITTPQNFVAHELLGSRSIYLKTLTKAFEVRPTTKDFTPWEDDNFTMSMPIELEAVRIADSFVTPTVAVPPTYTPNGDNYYEPGFIHEGYFNP